MTSAAQQQKRFFLRASIKLLVAVGFLFLLIPFCSSVFKKAADTPVDGILVQPADLREGHTRPFVLSDGSTVFVTRNSAALQQQLKAIPAEQLWFPTAPGLLSSTWLVVAATTASGDTVAYQMGGGNTMTYFQNAGGNVWDVAGRALKPNALPSALSTMKALNLMPMPFRRHGDGILLLPLPSASVPEEVSP